MRQLVCPLVLIAPSLPAQSVARFDATPIGRSGSSPLLFDETQHPLAAGSAPLLRCRARMSELARAAGLAYRSAGDSRDRVALLVHGYPESSYMWRDALPALQEAGWRALAPDLPGYGDSEPDPPGSWERHVEALERFVRELELGPVALVTHDWGVAIGLRWACDHPGSARALAISDGGFFSDRRWHDLANVMRTPDEGERLVGSFIPGGFVTAP